MEHKKKLQFTIQNNGNGQVAPRWREVEVENAECPNCHQIMTVVIPGGEMQFIYAFCSRCQKYFLGE